MRRQILYILIISVSLLSCETDVDIKLPEAKPLLSVYGFLSPEDTITEVIVKSTNPFFGDKNSNTLDYIADARVTITNKGEHFILPYSEQTQSYYLDSNLIKIIPGEQYNLEVLAHDFPTVTSSVVIHESKNESLELIKTTKPSGADDFYYFNVQWTDIPGERNYYRLTGYVNEQSHSVNLTGNEIFLYDDMDWDYQTISSNELFYRGTLDEVHLILLSIDYHYYQYHKTVRNFDLYGDMPFSEPTFVYSNIKDGVGVFASYRKYEIVKNL